jgi:hypothetical protein
VIVAVSGRIGLTVTHEAWVDESRFITCTGTIGPDLVAGASHCSPLIAFDSSEYRYVTRHSGTRLESFAANGTAYRGYADGDRSAEFKSATMRS